MASALSVASQKVHFDVKETCYMLALFGRPSRQVLLVPFLDTVGLSLLTSNKSDFIVGFTRNGKVTIIYTSLHIRPTELIFEVHQISTFALCVDYKFSYISILMLHRKFINCASNPRRSDFSQSLCCLSYPFTTSCVLL